MKEEGEIRWKVFQALIIGIELGFFLAICLIK